MPNRWNPGECSNISGESRLFPRFGGHHHQKPAERVCTRHRIVPIQNEAPEGEVGVLLHDIAEGEELSVPAAFGPLILLPLLFGLLALGIPCLVMFLSAKEKRVKRFS